MEIKFWLNGRKIQTEIQADTLLLDLLREKGMLQCKERLRDGQLRSVHSSGRR